MTIAALCSMISFKVDGSLPDEISALVVVEGSSTGVSSSSMTIRASISFAKD